MLAKYSRYFLVFFNFLFLVTGIIILSVGLTIKAYLNEFETFLDDKYFYASDFLIIIGVVIFLIAFFGCCGALKENACMTLTFSTLLIVIFILEIMVGIGGFILKNKTEDYLKTTLYKTMKQYDNNNTEVTALWDTVQKEFHCCGVTNYTDWNTQTNTTNGYLPISCCDFQAGAFNNVTCGSRSGGLHQLGCLQAFGDYIEGHAMSIESVGLGFGILQLLGIVLSCYLSKRIKNGYETV